jgi:NADH-quinone oxidoreductase subunit M
MKLALYSFSGSALVLAGLLWIYANGHAAGFGLGELARAATALGHSEQVVVFAFLFTGFAILAGMFPFHTWAPTGHVAAPTGASMLLAGVVMKLGAYGCLRVAMPLVPAGLDYWQGVIGFLAVAGILYAGLVALVQDDFKFVIGYSSVSHMGFVLLGLAAATPTAVAGAVLQMFSHGVIAGLLFAVVGRMVYERTHTRQLDELRKLPLHRLLPFAAVTFVIAGLASMGMPAFSGFPAELTILIGVWQFSKIWAILAALGILIAAAFTLRATQVAFFGQAGAQIPAATPDHAHPFAPITWPEKTGTALLLATTLLIGLKPDLLLNWIVPSLQSPLLRAIWHGGAQ